MTPQPGDADRVTIHDVARAAGVSRQTVSNAVNNPERVRPDTLERVRAAIDELGYRASSSAQSLRSRRAGAVGIELHTLGAHNATTAPVLTALSIGAARHGCHIVPFGSQTGHPMLEGYRSMWAGRLVDAFVLAETHHGDPRPPWLEEQGIPYATFGRVWDDPTFTRWVDVDGGAGTEAAVRHCRDQGYERVAFLGWPAGRSSVTTAVGAGPGPAPTPAASPAPTRSPSRTSTTPRPRPPRCSSTSPPATPSCAPPTCSPSASTTPSCAAGSSPVATSASSASTAPRPRRCTTSPRSPSPSRPSPRPASTS